MEAGVEAGVVVGQASSSNMKHSSSSNVNAIAGHKRSSSIVRQRQAHLAA